MKAPLLNSTARGPRLPRPFTAMLAAAAVSSVGDGVRLAAFPLLALSITTNPVAVTSLAVANRLPWLLVSLFSGAIADRLDRRTLMVGVDVVRGAAVAALAAALLLGADHLLVLYVVAIILGIGETLFTVAAQGLLPGLVDQEDLGTANGRLFTTQMVGSNFAGPVIGGWLFSVNRVLPFAVDAISFLLGSALLSVVPRARADAPANRSSLLSEIRVGIDWLWRQRLLRSFLVVVTVVNLTQSASQSLLVLLATGQFGVPPSGFGWLLAASGAGAFLGGMLSRRVGDRLGVPWVLLPSIALSCPIFLVMAWAEEPVVLGAALALNAFLGLVVNVQMVTLRQRIVPADRLSRVASVNMFAAFGFAIPVGAIGGGLLAEAVGVRAVYVICAAVIAVLVLTVIRDMRPSAVGRTIAALLGTPEGKPSGTA
jgi:predicted MFS family arabinose efflux permease